MSTLTPPSTALNLSEHALDAIHTARRPALSVVRLTLRAGLPVQVGPAATAVFSLITRLVEEIAPRSRELNIIVEPTFSGAHLSVRVQAHEPACPPQRPDAAPDPLVVTVLNAVKHMAGQAGRQSFPGEATTTWFTALVPTPRNEWLRRTTTHTLRAPTAAQGDQHDAR